MRHESVCRCGLRCLWALLIGGKTSKGLFVLSRLLQEQVESQRLPLSPSLASQLPSPSVVVGHLSSSVGSAGDFFLTSAFCPSIGLDDLFSVISSWFAVFSQQRLPSSQRQLAASS